MNELRKRFLRDVKNVTAPEALVTAVELTTGAVEIATNSTKLASKIEYIIDKYDDEFKLKANPSIRIIGYMLI